MPTDDNAARCGTRARESGKIQTRGPRRLGQPKGRPAWNFRPGAGRAGQDAEALLAAGVPARIVSSTASYRMRW